MRRNRVLEAAVLVALIGVLAVTAIERVWQLRFAAERSAVDSVVGALHTALSIEVGRRALADGPQGLAVLPGSNPFRLLKEPPSNYRGRLPAGDVPPGAWYFDPASGECIYKFRFGGETGPGEIRYRIAARYEDVNRSGRFEPEADKLQNVVLERTFPSTKM